MEFLYIILVIGMGVVWGYATNTIIHNKGYSENWFWWGFFFGLIAVIVAACKPQCPSQEYTQPTYKSTAAIQEGSEANRAAALKQYKELLDNGVITQEEFESKKRQILGL